MIRVDDTAPRQQCTLPWVFDRIEISGRIFTGPAEGSHIRADFERPTEEIRFSLVGAWRCDYQSGPHLAALANYCANVTGRAGFYGLTGARRVG